MTPIKISVTWEDLSIIGHAISWHLSGQYERIPKPQLVEEETIALTRLHNNICEMTRMAVLGVHPLILEVGDTLFLFDNKLLLPKKCLHLITDAVECFFAEIGHSPTEVEIITGVAAIKTPEVLAKLQANNDRIN